METLLVEHNIVSLRSAFVLDDGDLIYFLLLPRWLDSSVPRSNDYGKSDLTCVYRRKRSFFTEIGLLRSLSPLQRCVKPIKFATTPELKLLWADSGHSVALILNGEPWSFIHEEKNHGFSKGVLRASLGNPWDQDLFERTFKPI